MAQLNSIRYLKTSQAITQDPRQLSGFFPFLNQKYKRIKFYSELPASEICFLKIQRDLDRSTELADSTKIDETLPRMMVEGNANETRPFR